MKRSLFFLIFLLMPAIIPFQLLHSEEEIPQQDQRIYLDLRQAKYFTDFIDDISKWDENKNSVLWRLKDYLEQYGVATKDIVLEAFVYVRDFFKKNYHHMPADTMVNLNNMLNEISLVINDGNLEVDEFPTIRAFIIKVKEKLYVYDKAKFFDKVKFKNKVKFKEDVNIEGDLSVDEMVVGNEDVLCDLSVGCNISMVDSVDAEHGNIIKAGEPFIHTYPSICSGNTFIGRDAGNFTNTATYDTAVGSGALSNEESGYNNTAIGRGSMASNISGGPNTAVGCNSLFSNIGGVQNTAIGNYALFNAVNDCCNTAVGDSVLASTNGGSFNTAVGQGAMTNNTVGYQNTAIGESALYYNTIGYFNTALGQGSMAFNTEGFYNTAAGYYSLVNNTQGVYNTAVGSLALSNSESDIGNTGIGTFALYADNEGLVNTAVGFFALAGLRTGIFNSAFGAGAGDNYISDESNNIVINNFGIAGDSGVIRIGTQGTQNDCYIAGIYGAPHGVINAPVIVDNTGKLGTLLSSASVKHDIQAMADKSALIYQLNPVTFVYNFDETETKQYGLIAEEVDAVFSDIVVHDEDGKPFTVQYNVLPVLLLNEMIKQNRRIEILEKAVSRLVALETIN